MTTFKTAMPLVFALLVSVAPATAMGFFDHGDNHHGGGGNGSVSTPAPIAGAGVVYLVIAGAAGAFLVMRTRRKRD